MRSAPNALASGICAGSGSTNRLTRTPHSRAWLMQVRKAKQERKVMREQKVTKEIREIRVQPVLKDQPDLLTFITKQFRHSP